MRADQQRTAQGSRSQQCGAQAVRRQGEALAGISHEDGDPRQVFHVG